MPSVKKSFGPRPLVTAAEDDVIYTSYSDSDPHVQVPRHSKNEFIIFVPLASSAPYDAHHPASAVVPHVVRVWGEGQFMNITPCADWDSNWRMHAKAAPLFIGTVELKPAIPGINSVHISPPSDTKIHLAIGTRDGATFIVALDVRQATAGDVRLQVSHSGTPEFPIDQSRTFLGFVTTAPTTSDPRPWCVTLSMPSNASSTVLAERLADSNKGFIAHKVELAKGIRWVQYDAQRNLLHVVQNDNGAFLVYSYRVGTNDKGLAGVKPPLVASARLCVGKGVDPGEAPLAPHWHGAGSGSALPPILANLTVLTPCATPSYATPEMKSSSERSLQVQPVYYCSHFLTQSNGDQHSFITIVNGRIESPDGQMVTNAYATIDVAPGNHNDQSNQRVSFVLFEPLSLLTVIEYGVIVDPKTKTRKQLHHLFKVEHPHAPRFLLSRERPADSTFKYDEGEWAMHQVLVSPRPRVVYNLPFCVRTTKTCITVRRVAVRYSALLQALRQFIVDYANHVSKDERAATAFEWCARGALVLVSTWPFGPTGQRLDPTSPSTSVKSDECLLRQLKELFATPAINCSSADDAALGSCTIDSLSDNMINDWLMVYGSSVGSLALDLDLVSLGTNGPYVTTRDLVPLECRPESKGGSDALSVLQLPSYTPPDNVVENPLRASASITASFRGALIPESVFLPHLRRIVDFHEVKFVGEDKLPADVVRLLRPHRLDINFQGPVRFWQRFDRFTIKPDEARKRALTNEAASPQGPGRSASPTSTVPSHRQEVLARLAGFSELALLARLGSAGNDVAVKISPKVRRLANEYVERTSKFPTLLHTLSRELDQPSAKALHLQLKVIMKMYHLGLPVGSDASECATELADKLVHPRLCAAMRWVGTLSQRRQLVSGSSAGNSGGQSPVNESREGSAAADAASPARGREEGKPSIARSVAKLFGVTTTDSYHRKSRAEQLWWLRRRSTLLPASSRSSVKEVVV